MLESLAPGADGSVAAGVDRPEGLSVEIILERNLEGGMSGSPVINSDDAVVSLLASQMPGGAYCGVVRARTL